MIIHHDDLVQFTREYLENNPRSPWQLYQIMDAGLELTYRIKPEINGNDLSKYIADDETYLVVYLPEDGSKNHVEMHMGCNFENESGLPHQYCICYDRSVVILANPYASMNHKNYYFRHYFMHDLLHKTTREEHRLYDHMYVPPSHHLMAKARQQEQEQQKQQEHRHSTTTSLFQFLHKSFS